MISESRATPSPKILSRLFLTTRRFLAEQARTAVLLFDAIRPIAIIGKRRFVDAGPLLLHLRLDILARYLPIPGNQAVDKVASEVYTNKPDPGQSGKCEGDEQCGAEDETEDTDPEERGGDSGEKGEGEGAEDKGGEEEDGDKGEEKLGNNEGLSKEERGLAPVALRSECIGWRGERELTKSNGLPLAKTLTVS